MQLYIMQVYYACSKLITAFGELEQYLSIQLYEYCNIKKWKDSLAWPKL